MLKVNIISPSGVIFDGDAHLVSVPSSNGEMGIMQKHEIVVTTLLSGKIIIYNQQNDILKELEIAGGFAEIHDDGNKLLLLIDIAY